MIGVLPGMYSGSLEDGMDGMRASVVEERGSVFSEVVIIGARKGDAGSFTGAASDSRVFTGTGGNSRSVSFKTARTG